MNLNNVGLLILLTALGVAQQTFTMYPPQTNTRVKESTSKLWDLISRAHQDDLRISTVESLAAAAKEDIEAGAQINAVDQSSGETPLMRLAYSKTPLALALAQALLDKKADLGVRSTSIYTTQGWTALDFAIYTNNFELADLLLKAGAPRQISPTVRPAQSDNTLLFVRGAKTLDQIRKEEYGPDYQNQPTVATKKLFELANVGYLRSSMPLEKVKQDIQALIDQGANLKENRLDGDSLVALFVRDGGNYPHLAALLDFLVSKGADLHQPSNYTPLMYAVMNNDSGTVKYLISKGVDRSKKRPRIGSTAYDLAIMLPQRKAALAPVLDLLDPNKPLPASAAAPVKLVPKTAPAPARDLRNVPAQNAPQAGQAPDLRKMQ